MSTSKKRGLGKGLDALLMTEPKTFNTSTQTLAPMALPVGMLEPGEYQPRKSMSPNALAELSASIKAQGVLQPVLVRPLKNKTDRYEIIAGERRWRAAQLAGLKEVPVVVKEFSDASALEVGLIENIQRVDLNPLEKARGLQELIKKFSLTQAQIAEKIGWPRSTVTNFLRLNTLAKVVQDYLTTGELDMGHARAILALAPERQEQAANSVVARKLTVRETEDLVRRMQIVKPVLENSNHPVRHASEEKLEEKLGLNVKLNLNTKGKGKVVIYLSQKQDLDDLLDKLS